MKPVWIKYYGIIPMTKWGYLVALSVAGAVVFVIFTGLLLLGLLPPLSTMWRPDPNVGRAIGSFPGWFYNFFWWFSLLCLIAQGIDTYCVLRKFAQKEEEQRRSLAIQYDDESRPAQTPPRPETHVRPAQPRYSPPDEHVR